MNQNQMPVVLAINNANIDAFYPQISNIMFEFNFKFVKKFPNGSFWTYYLFEDQDLKFETTEFKKTIKKSFPQIEFEENLLQLDLLVDTDIKVIPSEENELLFNCFQLFLPKQIPNN